MRFKKLIVFSLITLFYQLQVSANSLDFQAISKSIEWAGEIPTSFMQKKNLGYIEDFKQQLSDGKWGVEPGSMTPSEARILIKIADASIKYHTAVDLFLFQSTSEIPLPEASEFLFEKQIAFRNEVIELLLSVMRNGKPSFDFLKHHLIYLWDASAMKPRITLSPEQMTIMKEELKGWFDLTELTLRAAREHPGLESMAHENFYRMMGETLIETTVFQKEMVTLLPHLNSGSFDSVKTYAVVKEVMAQMNLPIVDPMKSLQIEGLFPGEVREAYKELSELFRLVNGEKYLEAPRPNDLTQLWRNLKPLVNQQNGSSVPSEFIRAKKIKGYSEVASNWDSYSVTKSYHQQIKLIMDFIAYSVRAENPTQPKQVSSGPFDPRSIQFSDFLSFDKIMMLLPDNILATNVPPGMADILSKIMAEFIPLYTKEFGADPAEMRGLIQDYVRFAEQRPHDPYLTRLAYDLSKAADLPSELRLVTMNYVKNSAFGKAMAGSYNPHLERRLRNKLARRAGHWTLKKGLFENSDMVLANINSGEKTVDTSLLKNVLASAPGRTDGAKQCVRLFQF